MMLKRAAGDLGDEHGAYFWCRLDDSLSKLWCIQASTKTQERLIRDLFVDESTPVAHTQLALQHITSCFAGALRLFGLEIDLM